MIIHRAAGERSVQGIEQDRNQQTEQDHQTSGQFIWAHLIMKDDDTLQGCAERRKSTHHPCPFRGGAALGNRLKGEAEPAADNGQSQDHCPLRTGLRQPGLFQNEGHDEGKEANREDLRDADHQWIAFAGGNIGDQNRGCVEDC